MKTRWNCSMFERLRITLIKPAIPAAASRCPMFVFTEPIAQGPFVRSSTNYFSDALASIESPNKCSCSMGFYILNIAGEIPAAWYASRNIASCASCWVPLIHWFDHLDAWHCLKSRHESDLHQPMQLKVI